MRVESFRRRLYKTSYFQGHTRMCWFKIFSCYFKRNHLQTTLSSVSTDPFFVSLVFISHRKSSQERLFWWALLMCSQACLYKLTKIHGLSVSKVMVWSQFMSGCGATMSHHVTNCSISAALPQRSGAIEVMSQFGKMWMTH